MRGLVVLAVAAGVVLAQHRNARNPGVEPPSASPAFKDLVVKFDGTLKNLGKKEILIETDDTHEIMTFRRSKDTKFYENGVEVKATRFDLESHVTIEAKQDPDSKLRAVAVRTSQAQST
ncbi:MAG TPA: hypothetical protein VKT81_14545 [Bryobacteraceae bacterium]|nr:hypothetical protein [Bryobacteraceae bacterium]